MKINYAIGAFLCMLVCYACSSPKTEVKSPDGHIKMSFTLDENGTPFYNVSVGDSLLIENSAMGFTEGNGVALGEGFQIKSTTFDHKDEIWTQAWGENKKNRDHYNEMAVSHNFEGTEMLESIGKLLFFLILWFVVGIYLIPEFLKRCRKLMGEETLLIVSLALCFGMVVMAANTGFSAAFGAFIMGSILAETIEAESIDRLVKPVKDLFGAIFFVSVGMMVDPAMIIEYAIPIIVITIAVILGQATFGTFGVILSGKPLKTAMQCGFSLTQIGEFAFIIASLGVSLHVTSDFLYPIVVAVSVITTFLTPYMIRLAEPA